MLTAKSQTVYLTLQAPDQSLQLLPIDPPSRPLSAYNLYQISSCHYFCRGSMPLSCRTRLASLKSGIPWGFDPQIAQELSHLDCLGAVARKVYMLQYKILHTRLCSVLLITILQELTLIWQIETNSFVQAHTFISLTWAQNCCMLTP